MFVIYDFKQLNFRIFTHFQNVGNLNHSMSRQRRQRAKVIAASVLSTLYY